MKFNASQKVCDVPVETYYRVWIFWLLQFVGKLWSSLAIIIPGKILRRGRRKEFSQKKEGRPHMKIILPKKWKEGGGGIEIFR